MKSLAHFFISRWFFADWEMFQTKVLVKIKAHFVVRHPCCVGSITKNLVYYTYSRTQLYFPSSTVGIQLHVSALYVGHLQVMLWLTEPLVTALGNDTQYRNNEIPLSPIPSKNTPHILHSCSVSQSTTWRWPTYRAETRSCIPTVLLWKYSCVGL